MRTVRSRMFWVAGTGAVAAGLLCVVALARALTVRPVPPTVSEVPGVVSAAELERVAAPPARVPSEGVLPLASLALAVDHDPFMPDRRRAARYILPGESSPQPAELRVEEALEPPPFRVIGTAVVGESGLAVVQPLKAGPVEVVRVGESLLGYRLASVDNESATLTIRSRTFTLGVQPGSQGLDVRGVADAGPTAENQTGWQPFNGFFAETGLNLGRELPMGVLLTGRGGRGEISIDLAPGVRAGPGRGGAAIPGRRVRPDTSRIELSQSNERD